MHPLFIILTPTHKRPTELARAVQSVRTQTHAEYVHIVINDSPEHDYAAIEQSLQIDEKIVYIKNEKNIGKNASLNAALAHIQSHNLQGYVIFLDDDDWLHPNALEDIAHIVAPQGIPWLVTERALAHSKDKEVQKSVLTKYNYFWDYLLRKKLTGDKTHTISTELLFSKSKPSFSTQVKNGEEWFFFCQLSPTFHYTPLPSTLTNGYTIDGLNERAKETYRQNIFLLLRERWHTRMLLYLFFRSIFITFKYHD